jgi:tight adherence protein B
MSLDTVTLLTIAVAAGAALTVGVLVAAALGMRSRDAGLGARLQSIADRPLAPQEPALPGDALRPGGEIADRLNSAINRRGFGQRVARSLEQANLPFTVSEWLLICLAVPLVLTLGGLLLWREPLLAPLTMLAGLAAPPLWLASLRHRRSALFADQLAETLNLLVSALRGGFSLSQSLAMVAREAQEPTRSELNRVVQEMQLGLALGDSLDNLCERIIVEDLELIVTAIKVNARVGGNLTEILENISTTIRERSKLRRDVQVITSMQRISSYVIGALPFGLALIIYTINPTYMGRLFEPGWILCVPVTAFTMAVAGFVLIRRIADIKV